MEEINLKDLLNYYLSKIFIVIIAFCISIFVSVIYSEFIKVPMYKSTSTVVLASAGENNGNNNSITQNDITINQKLIATYREIIKSRRVLGQVITNLKLDITPDELSRSITVTNQAETDVIRISVSHVKREEAAKIANEIAKVFSNEIVDIYNIKNVSIIDTAIEASNPYNINVIKDAIIAAVLGIVLGCGIIFVMFYFDTTIKNPEEIQSKIGLPLLGIVPLVDDKKRKDNKRRGRI